MLQQPIQELHSGLSPTAVVARVRDQPEVRLLDVRTRGQFGAVHLRCAYNLTLDALGERAREILKRLPTPIVLVYQAGQQARKAEAALQAARLRQLHVLDGGTNARVAAGLSVVRGMAWCHTSAAVRTRADGRAA